MNFIQIAFAHELEEGAGEITNLAEADWWGPIMALLILIIVVIISRKIKSR